MKKLLALLLCFGLVSSMGLGIVGCDKGKTEAEKKKEKEEAEAKKKKEEEEAAKKKAGGT
jgi:hypothetical protein